MTDPGNAGVPPAGDAQVPEESAGKMPALPGEPAGKMPALPGESAGEMPALPGRSPRKLVARFAAALLGVLLGIVVPAWVIANRVGRAAVRAVARKGEAGDAG